MNSYTAFQTCITNENDGEVSDPGNFLNTQRVGPAQVSFYQPGGGVGRVPRAMGPPLGGQIWTPMPPDPPIFF